MTPKNIPEFIALIKRYESITIEDIGEKSAGELTGFGNTRTCTLCTPIDGNCNKCVYLKNIAGNHNSPCCSGILERTYILIAIAQNAEELLTAFRNRAAAMREYAKTIGIEII